MFNNYQNFINYLFTFQDLEYQKFTQKLTNTNYEIIGIRIPTLRKIADQIFKEDYQNFLSMIKFRYFEEVFISILVIAKITDEKEFFKYTKLFIPKIDDWSICDSFCNSIKIIQENPSKYLNKVLKYLNSQKEFIVRVGLIIILNYYITENNLSTIFTHIDKIKLDKYYVNMAIAWLLCEIYIHYPKETEIILKLPK